MNKVGMFDQCEGVTFRQSRALLYVTAIVRSVLTLIRYRKDAKHILGK